MSYISRGSSAANIFLRQCQHASQSILLIACQWNVTATLSLIYSSQRIHVGHDLSPECLQHLVKTPKQTLSPPQFPYKVISSRLIMPSEVTSIPLPLVGPCNSVFLSAHSSYRLDKINSDMRNYITNFAADLRWIRDQCLPLALGCVAVVRCQRWLTCHCWQIDIEVVEKKKIKNSGASKVEHFSFKNKFSHFMGMETLYLFIYGHIIGVPSCYFFGFLWPFAKFLASNINISNWSFSWRVNTKWITIVKCIQIPIIFGGTKTWKTEHAKLLGPSELILCRTTLCCNYSDKYFGAFLY